ncbi:MAG: S-adenosyl-l-methionine hydroxide adenosyltransferase family protein [Actinomycetota bacterium]
MARPIVFLSDYGLDDEFVGLCHAVMATISPGSRVIDLTHAVPPQDILRGALVLAQSLPYLPTDAVVIAVVDPGVGTERRSIAVQAVDGDRLLVGPDNGVLSISWGEGGPTSAVEITSREVVLQPVSRTFHGRDVFAPVAAHLAGGWPLERLGPGVDPTTLSRVEVPQPEIDADGLHAEVLSVDRYGNLQLSARPADLDSLREPLEVVSSGRGYPVSRAETFADVAEGQLAVVVDSAGWVAVVVNRGSAAESLDVTEGQPITLRARTVP